MKPPLGKLLVGLRELARSRFLSPRGFMARALLLAVVFAVCELAGWREHTTFISGTATSTNVGINTAVTLGLIYMLAYFGFVLGAPILLLAAWILAGFNRWRGADGHADCEAASTLNKTPS